MKKVYWTKMTPEIERILDETHDAFFEMAKRYNPYASQLSDEKEISQLHDLLPLLRMGSIKLYRTENCEDIIIEIRE